MIPLDERAALRKEFEPAAQRHRRRQRTLLVVMLLAAVLFFVAALSWPGILAKLALAGMVVSRIVMLSQVASLEAAEILCPSCRNDVDDNRGPFCPFCGGRTVAPRRWPLAPRCTACRTSLRRTEDGFQRRVRACTHCGLWLDDKGLNL